jgi:hypothetical protein
MAKATTALVARRIEEVLRIRLDGAEFWDVREYAREKEAEAGSAWELLPGGKPLSDGQLWRYVSRADKLIAESCLARGKKMLRRHLGQRRNLYAKAISQGDVRTALAVLSDEAKLLGLYPPAKMEHTGAKGEAIKIISIEAIKPSDAAPAPGAAPVSIVPLLVEAVKPDEEQPQ